MKHFQKAVSGFLVSFLLFLPSHSSRGCASKEADSGSSNDEDKWATFKAERQNEISATNSTLLTASELGGSPIEDDSVSKNNGSTVVVFGEVTFD